MVIILHTAQKESLCVLVCRFCISKKGGKGLTGGGRWVTHRVTCTWWLLGLAVKVPWLEPVGPVLALKVRMQDFSSTFSGLDDRLLNFKQKMKQNIIAISQCLQ